VEENIRIRVSGLFVENGKVLLVKHQKYGKEYYLLPGGGQDSGETAVDALKREWKEELDLSITVGELLFSGESVPKKDLNRRHVLQMVFKVTSTSGKINLVPDGPLVDYHWEDIGRLGDITIYPQCLPQIKSALSGEETRKFETYVWTD